MPRVYTAKKNRAGKARSCETCQAEILPGETYFSWEFRYGGKHFACHRHRPRPSQLTQSKMGTVYAAIETAEDELPGAEGVGDVSDIVSVVAEACEEVMEEYREAAEPFGGQGENAERADELEGWLSELQDFYPDEPSEERVEFDEDQARLEAIEQLLPEGTDPAKLTPEQAEEITEAVDDRRTRAEEINNEVDETLEAARNEATELLGGCPL